MVSFNDIENLFREVKLGSTILCDMSESKEDSEKNLQKLFYNLTENRIALQVISEQLQDLSSKLAFDVRIDKKNIFRLTERTKTGGRTLPILDSDNLETFAENLMILNLGYQLGKFSLNENLRKM